MTSDLLEKEAKEYRESQKHKSFRADVGTIQINYESYLNNLQSAFQKGAEFGYNKANEWHYVKDGDLPKDDKQYLVLFFYNYKGKKEMSYGVRDNLHSDFEIHRCYTEQIIAWKEIVLPELKESE